MFDELIERLESEYFAPGRENHLFHILAANAETSPTYAGYDLIFGVVCRSTCKTQFAKVLNASHLVPCAVPSSSVIFASMMIWGLNSLGIMKSGD
jgi:hypothetical protein